VNWHHFQAFLWLRWRLLVNQMRRSGFVSVVVLFLVAAAGLVTAVSLFFVMFFLGLLVLPEAPSPTLLYVWDGLVVGFLFAWCIGLISELQRSEVLSLEKFLHLPVSLKGAFLINYLSSLISVSLVLFLPAMIGLGLSQIFVKGPAMLLTFPLLAAFLLMVSALTYQFQSWLASLMVNKRRRRTVIAIVTVGFVLLCQTPNLVNVIRPWEGKKIKEDGTHADELKARMDKELADLQREVFAGNLSTEDFQKRRAELLQANNQPTNLAFEQGWDKVANIARLLNMAFPPGWLPLGVQDASEGNVLPALLATTGFGLIGAGSLWRSYRTTVRLYTGQFSAGAKPAIVAAPALPAPGPLDRPPARFLEKKLPWLSEQSSVIALGGFRSLLRAPEAKMLLLTPVIMVIVFGSLLASRATDPPDGVRPLIAFGSMAMILLTLVQLVGNQFGFDRGGFRVFVLCPAKRRDILLGKNLAVAPLALTMCALAVVVVQVVYHMSIDHFLAAWIQSLSMFLLFCLLANGLSMLAPLPIAAGSVKPMSPKGLALLLHFAFMFVFPVTIATTLLPLGIELGLEALTSSNGWPICLVLTIAECVAIIFLYRFLLTFQGKLLQVREKRILEIVATKAE
jgi:ABC-2 type transport system permease protein